MLQQLVQFPRSDRDYHLALPGGHAYSEGRAWNIHSYARTTA